MSESKAKQHGGIKRLAQPGDIGRVFGWGYAGPDSAVLNIELRDRTVVAMELPPLWACEMFAEFKDLAVIVGDPGQGEHRLSKLAQSLEEVMNYDNG